MGDVRYGIPSSIDSSGTDVPEMSGPPSVGYLGPRTIGDD